MSWIQREIISSYRFHMVAKLDRLSRDVHLISGLIKHRVNFIVTELGTDVEPLPQSAGVLHLASELREDFLSPGNFELEPAVRHFRKCFLKSENGNSSRQHWIGWARDLARSVGDLRGHKDKKFSNIRDLGKKFFKKEC